MRLLLVLILYHLFSDAADIPVDRADRLRVELLEDSITFAVDSADKLKDLLIKAKTSLSKLYSQIFPRLSLVTGLEALTSAFWAEHANPINVIKRNHRLLGATLTFQQLMGHGVDAEFEDLSATRPVDAEGNMADLGEHRVSARTCAINLINLVDEEKAQLVKESTPAGSTPAPSNRSPKP